MELFKLLKYSTTVICFCTFALYLNERFWLIGSGNSIKSSPREFLLVIIEWNALHTQGILFFLVAARAYLSQLSGRGLGAEERRKNGKRGSVLTDRAPGGRRCSN